MYSCRVQHVGRIQLIFQPHICIQDIPVQYSFKKPDTSLQTIRSQDKFQTKNFYIHAIRFGDHVLIMKFLS